VGSAMQMLPLRDQGEPNVGLRSRRGTHCAGSMWLLAARLQRASVPWQPTQAVALRPWEDLAAASGQSVTLSSVRHGDALHARGVASVHGA